MPSTDGMKPEQVFDPGVRGADFHLEADANEDGSFMILGVPPGKCRVTGTAYAGADRCTRTLQAEFTGQVSYSPGASRL